MEIDEVSGENSITPAKRRESKPQIIRPNDFLISENLNQQELQEESKDQNEDRDDILSSLPSGSDQLIISPEEQKESQNYFDFRSSKKIREINTV